MLKMAHYKIYFLKVDQSSSTDTDRARAKRRRNRTIDNHDLWCGTVAVVTQKTYTKEDSPQAGYTREETGCQTTASTDHGGEVSDGGDAVGQGLGQALFLGA